MKVKQIYEIINNVTKEVLGEKPITVAEDLSNIVDIGKEILNGTDIDNTSGKYVEPWLNAIKEICPQQVMIYTIDRDTPAVGLKKAEPKVLDSIKRQVEELGVACSVAY